jgi:hypothetical protein
MEWRFTGNAPQLYSGQKLAVHKLTRPSQGKSSPPSPPPLVASGPSFFSTFCCLILASSLMTKFYKNEFNKNGTILAQVKRKFV